MNEMNEMVCEEKRESQVRKQMQYIEKEIEGSVELLKQVRERFSAVTREEIVKEKCMSEERDSEEMSPLAFELQEFAWKIQEVSEGYKNMLSRVEL